MLACRCTQWTHPAVRRGSGPQVSGHVPQQSPLRRGQAAVEGRQRRIILGDHIDRFLRTEDEAASRADGQLDERLRAGNPARPVTGAGEAGRQIQPRAKNLKRRRDVPAWARRDSVTASG
jgi:hypothetical protein